MFHNFRDNRIACSDLFPLGGRYFNGDLSPGYAECLARRERVFAKKKVLCGHLGWAVAVLSPKSIDNV
jgi:hypothetical protein